MRARITPKRTFLGRRSFIKKAISAGLLCGSPLVLAETLSDSIACKKLLLDPISSTQKKFVTSYNNYYEFSTNKKMVRHIAKEFDYSDWTLNIGGLVENPITLNLKQIMALPTCERVYRLRCIEGWSAVIPWQGIELQRILEFVKPLSNAKFVKFESVFDPKQMPGQRTSNFSWPYVEGITLDEAMHPLTILATGMYSESLPVQNGAPIRLVVPWKYGYKSIKAIQQLTLVEEQPQGSWQQAVPSEYGFYGNVNPNVPHPRWSQRRELPLGENKKVRTKLLNGYARQLERLYSPDIIDTLF